MSHTTDHHHAFVADQYGPRAADYLASTVHAAGEDLDQIEAAVRGRSAARVLDLGCGGGHVSYRVAPHVAEVVAVDLAPEMLAVVRATAEERGLQNVRTQQAPAERLPLPDGLFDLVVCRLSAHHWHDLDAGLRESRRVLAPRGQALFVDVIAPESPLLDTHLQALELLRDPSHVRDHSAAEWVAALSRAGFALTSIRRRRLRAEFSSWIARTRTPEPLVLAIRSLQRQAPSEVRSHFALEEDGSFTLDTLTLVAVAL